MLYEVLAGEPATFENVDRIIPDVGGQGKARPLLPGGGRLIKTHEQYRSEYRKAVYLVRDLRDVVLSLYAYEKALGRISGEFHKYLSAFVRAKADGFGAWHKHVSAWLDSPLAREGNLLVIKFEEMRQKPEDSLAQIMTFLGVDDVNLERIRTAIANNSVQKMRAKEDDSPQISAASRGVTEEDRFIRSGHVGGWRNKRSDAQVELLEMYAGSALVRMGYVMGSSLSDKAEQRMNVVVRD